MMNQQNKGPIINTHDLLCFICQDYFCRPVTTFCQHSFCQYCIEEFFLFADKCPICDTGIRQARLSPVPTLGEFVESVIVGEQDEIARLERRKGILRGYKRGKELDNLKVGMKVDIRDMNYIWCEGLIIRIISRVGEMYKFVRVSYINFIDRKQEDIRVNSERIAKHAFFTTRQDIPRYQDFSKNKTIQNFSNNTFRYI